MQQMLAAVTNSELGFIFIFIFIFYFCSECENAADAGCCDQ